MDTSSTNSTVSECNRPQSDSDFDSVSVALLLVLALVLVHDRSIAECAHSNSPMSALTAKFAYPGRRVPPSMRESPRVVLRPNAPKGKGVPVAHHCVAAAVAGAAEREKGIGNLVGIGTKNEIATAVEQALCSWK